MMSNANWWPESGQRAEFLAPSTVVSGDGASADAARLLAGSLGLAAGSVLVLVDDVVHQAGLTLPLLDALREAGYATVVRGGFGSEPTDEVIDAAAAAAREAKAEAVIGMGGGSVLDSSKILALLLRNEGRTADWIGPVDPPRGVAPLLLIPTTCGTGSEATRIAMVTVDGAKRASSCDQYVPRAVLLDPVLVSTLPGQIVAATAMDALAHAVESLMSTNRSPLSAHHALRAIELIEGSIEDAVAGDGDALGRCLWASHLAGQALNAGVVLGHSLAYCLAWEKPMPHGVSCALSLPYCIAYNGAFDDEIAPVLARSLTRGASSEMADAAVAVLELSRRLGLPTTLDEAGIPADTEREMAARCVSEYPRPTNPRPLDEVDLEQLLIAMRTGDIRGPFGVNVAARVERAK